MRKRTAGCLGALLGAVTVVWVEVHFINTDMKRMDAIEARALARALEEGPSQADYDARCAGEKRNFDQTRKLECERMEYYMQRARERRASKEREAAPGASSTGPRRPG